MSPVRTALTHGLFLDLVSFFFFPLLVSMLLGLAFLTLGNALWSVGGFLYSFCLDIR